jgi:lysyl-tRNA synthetase class 2
VSTRHNPEFTMLEYYQAYADYNELMDRTESLLRGLCQEVLGTSVIHYQGEDVDFGQPFRRITVRDALLKHYPALSGATLDDHASVLRFAQGEGIEADESWGLGQIWMALFEAEVEQSFRRPTFVTDYPKEVSPLARPRDDDPFVTERFELIVGGREIANGFSELNDPEDQAARFREQVAEKEAGDDEAMFYDEDFIRALEYGLPPTAGEGIGIDRLVMLLTDAPSIRDVLLFPAMRPQARSD